MAKVIFTEGTVAKTLADSGWGNLTAYLSTKPCSGGGAHVAGDTFVGGFGDLPDTSASTGYTPQAANEPAAASNGTKVWPTVSFSTGVNTDWPNAVKSVVYVDANSKLVYAEDLAATRDMAAAYRTITHTLTTTSTVS
jgi:hypothetical protein